MNQLETRPFQYYHVVPPADSRTCNFINRHTTLRANAKSGCLGFQNAEWLSAATILFRQCENCFQTHTNIWPLSRAVPGVGHPRLRFSVLAERQSRTPFSSSIPPNKPSPRQAIELQQNRSGGSGPRALAAQRSIPAAETDSRHKVRDLLPLTI